MPRRPLTLHPPGTAWRAWLLAIAALLLFGGAEIWLGMTVVPDILTDLPIRDAAQPVPSGRLNGRCSARFGLLQTCDVTLSVRGKSGALERQAQYVFVEPHLGDRTARVMVDPDHPEVLTTDFAVDFFWNRVVTAAVLALLCLALMLGGLFGAMATNKRRREAKSLSGRVLEAVPLVFGGWQQREGWIIRETVPVGERGIARPVGSRPVISRPVVWPVPRKAKPLVLDAQRGLVLGLRAEAGGPIFPVDEDLRWVELTDAERARLLAAAHLGGVPHPATQHAAHPTSQDPDATITQRPV